MKATIYIFSLTVLISSCGAADTQTKSVKADSTVHTAIDTPAYVPHPAPLTKEVTTLDSIEAANNKSVLASGDDVTKAWVNLGRGDSTIHLQADIKKDHRFYGYAHPDIRSERLILFSIFTNDVSGNPFKCKLGAYYNMQESDSVSVKYLSTDNGFVKTTVTGKTNTPSIVYFEKKWIDIE